MTLSRYSIIWDYKKDQKHQFHNLIQKIFYISFDISPSIPIPNTVRVNFYVYLDISFSTLITATAEVTTDGNLKTTKIDVVPKIPVSSGITKIYKTPSGTYDVILVFTSQKRSSCVIGNRVFNVYINSKLQLPVFAIMQSSNGCLKSVVRIFSSFSVYIANSN